LFGLLKVKDMTGEPEKIGLRQIFKLILPKEHGSWSPALEPLALGLLAAPSRPGGALAAAALAGFFLRRPLKLVSGGRPDSRRTLAFGCVIVLATFAIASLLLAVKNNGAGNLWPLIPAALAGVAFAWFDSRNEARDGAAEMAGAIAFGILPAAFGTLAGWSVIESLALAAVMLARSLPTVLFVRTYMRRKKGSPATPTPAFIAAGSAFLLTAWLVLLRVAPWPATAFALLLAARAVWLLDGHYPWLAAKTIGIAEMVLGAAMVLAVAVTWKCF
jgi:YwiC-like protein